LRRGTFIVGGRPSDPQIWVIDLGISSRLAVSLSDLFHDRIHVAVVVWIPEVGLCIVELVHDLCEIAAELSGAVRLVATLEIGDEACDHGVGGAEEDGSSPSPSVVEGTQHGKGSCNEDLEEEERVRGHCNKPIL